MSQSGLRGPKMIPDDQYNMFLTIWGHFGPNLAYKKILGKFTKVLGFGKTPPPCWEKFPNNVVFFFWKRTLNEIAGLFFVIYLEEFGETRSKTAWVFWFIHETCWVWPLWRFPAIFLQVGSLCSSVYLMYGPLVAASLDKFGLFCHLWKSSAIGSSSFLQAVELSWWAQASLPALPMSSQV